MFATGLGIVGRDVELAAIARFLDGGPGSTPHALLLEGDLGIGKSTVLEASLELARERQHRVLRCASASEEMRLSFVAVADLLAPVLDEVLPELPPPQRRALEIALLIRDLDGPPPDDRAVATAFHAALRTLAARGPVLVAVDDVQWLDAPSAATLAFAARRLGAADGVRLLLTRRLNGEGAAPLGLGRSGAPGLDRLRIGPLSLGAIDHLMRIRLAVSLRRPALIRVHDLSGGNPFFAVELARALAARGEAPAGGLLPVPGTLTELVHGRVAALPGATRAALLFVAAGGRLTPETLAAVLGEAPEVALRSALDAGVLVQLDDGAVSFAHPLLAAVVAGHAPAAERRRAHAALAAATDSVEERARHLAQSILEPDEQVAAELEMAAYSAGARGGYTAVAELAGRARELTPADERDAARRRAFLAGEASWAAGDYELGRQILQEMVDTAQPGTERADALLRLSRNPRDILESIELCRAALKEPDTDPTTRGDIETFLAMLTYGAGDVDSAADLAGRAASTSSVGGDARREALALSLHAMMDGLAARGFDFEVLRRTAAVEEATGPYPGRVGPRFFLASALSISDEHQEGRERGNAIVTEVRDLGDISYARALSVVSFLELRAGNLQRALSGAREALGVWQQAGLTLEQNEALGVVAQAEAELGLEREAREDADRITELPGGLHDLGEIRRGFALVTLELALERWPEAAAAAEVWTRAADRTGMRSSLLAPARPWAVEAFAGAGDLERARAAAAEVAAEAARTPHPRLSLYASRCRGHVLAAARELDEAVAELGRARAISVQSPCPLEHARTLLLLGGTLRRANRRTDARDALGEALAIYDMAGARLWAERARRELARIGGRAASRDELTIAERRVAELVAQGMSNREAAAALFVTVKTVEAALSRVYHKLGVRSRTELARRFAGLGP